jgi:hypothetical protein
MPRAFGGLNMLCALACLAPLSEQRRQRRPLGQGCSFRSQTLLMAAVSATSHGARAACLRGAVLRVRALARTEPVPRVRRLRMCIVASAPPPPPRLPDTVLQDVLRAPEQRQRRYQPHELLRAAVELDARGGGCKLMVCESLSSLLTSYTGLFHENCGVLLNAGFLDRERLHLLVLPPSTDASRTADVAAAQLRLLRLLATLEEHCPLVLHGCSRRANGASSVRGQRSKQSHIYRRLHTLVAFAAHVPDSSWANAPETWRPPRGKRRVHALRLAPCFLETTGTDPL